MRELLKDPHSYAASQTQSGKRIANALYQFAHPFKRRRLEGLASVVVGNACRCQSFTIENSAGYTLVDGREWRLAEDAVAEARLHFQNVDLPKLTTEMTDREPFTRVPWQPTPASAILQLATHECFLRPIATYFGTLPILRTVQLMFSPNNSTVNGSSQYYHLDGQDVKSLQVFIFVEEVTSDNGPLTLLDATTTEAVCRATGYRKAGEQRRLTDERVAAVKQIPTQPRELVGPAGSILMFDGDRCLHYGSRKATRPRHVLHMFFTSAFSFTLKAGETGPLRECAHGNDPLWKQVVLGAKTP